MTEHGDTHIQAKRIDINAMCEFCGKHCTVYRVNFNEGIHDICQKCWNNAKALGD